MTSAAIIAFFVLGGISASALLAFWWAAQDRQFENPKEGAKAVFDEDELLKPVSVRSREGEGTHLKRTSNRRNAKP
jgi:cbb3-type cytochrome oxidase maturation protein